jgi:hypothetical protein
MAMVTNSSTSVKPVGDLNHNRLFNNVLRLFTWSPNLPENPADSSWRFVIYTIDSHIATIFFDY